MNAVIALVLTLMLADSAHAVAQTTTDEGVWTGLSMRGRVSDAGAWRWSADTLTRSRDGVNTLEFLFEYAMVTRAVKEHVVVGFGYGFGAGFLESGTLFEHRGAQQLALTYGRRTRVTVRNLLEERFISGRDTALVRLREQAKVAWPLVASGRLNGIVSEEVLVQADTRSLSAPVFDANRLFIGVGRRLTPRNALEIGYLNVLSRVGAQGYRRSHVISLSLAATL